MADLGTVVGVVSLSLQVFEYVHTYVDALQGRKEDLTSTIRHCDTMQKLLEQTKTLQEKHPKSVNISSIAVQQAMSATAAEMSLLRDLIAKIAPNHPQPKSMAGRFDKQKQRMLYPFRRSNLEQLDERLARTNEALQSTLQLAVVETTTETGDILKGLQTDLGSSRAEMNDKLDNLQGMSQQGRNAISAVYQEASFTRAELQLFIPESIKQAQVSLEKIQNIERHVDGSSSLIFETHQNTLALRESVDELNMMLKDLRSPNVGVFCQKLISKPSTLKLICDQERVVPEPGQSAGQLSDTNLEDTYSSLFSCSCHRRRRFQRKRYQFGRAILAQETFTDNVHSSSCPFSDFSKPQTRRSIGISVTMFRAAIFAAMTFTMNSSSGAGGYGICLSFTYYPVRPTSPPLRVLAILMISYNAQRHQDYPRVVHKSLEVLRWAFKSGKASPFDRKENGENLLHDLLGCAILSSGSPESLVAVLEVAKFLVTAGVPRDKEDDATRLPWQYIISLPVYYGSSSHKSMQQLFEICWIGDHSTTLDFPCRHVFDGWPLPSFAVQQMLHQNLNDQADWLGNDLQLAIFRRDSNCLVEVLDGRPPTAEFLTQDAFGTTTLQMAVSWPLGLSIILDHIDNSVLQDHDKTNTPLIQCALSLSRRNCSKDYAVRCSDSCPCVDAVTLLLEANCPMLFRDDDSDGFHLATTRCKELFTDHLKKRRQKLAKLALLNLHPRDVSRFNLVSPSVLDYYTADVIAALDRQCVHVPRWLHTWSLSRSQSLCTKPRAGSVYQIIAKSSEMATDTIATLDRFYSAGFVDVDIASSCGQTPLMHVRQPRVFIWFLQHGVDLLTPMESTTETYVRGCLALHSLFFYVLRFGPSNRQQQERRVHCIMQLTEKLHGRPCNDYCICGCSVDGCHPWTMVWKEIHYKRSELPLRQNFDSLVRSRNELLGNLRDLADVSAEVKAIALRTITFDALQIRHTCCNGGRRRLSMDEDEVKEIREEDAIELERLEQLLVEFEHELEQQGCSLGHFFRTYWEDRMIQVFREIDQQTITKENQAGATELEVRLSCGEAGPVSPYGPAYWEEPDYWIEQLESIMI